LSNSSFRNPSRREVLSSPALRDLTLFVRNNEDMPKIAPAGALAGMPINTLCSTVLAPNPVSSTLVFQRQLRKKT
jgi:hypothetical protein